MEGSLRPTSRLPAVLLAVLLAWSALALVKTAYSTASLWAGRPPNFLLAARWLPGTRQVDKLERFLKVVAEATPPASRVAFLSDQSLTPDGFFVDLWAGYLLPEREVVPASDPSAWALASYVASYRTRCDAPGLKIIRLTSDGAIYRKLP
jgi:hypothetical protein